MTAEHETTAQATCIYCSHDQFNQRGRRRWCQSCGRLRYEIAPKWAVLVEGVVNAPKNLAEFLRNAPESFVPYEEVTQDIPCQWKECDETATREVERKNRYSKTWKFCNHHYTLRVVSEYLAHGLGLLLLISSIGIGTVLSLETLNVL